MKGRERVLIRDGRIDEGQMRRSRITIDDLWENLRGRGGVADLSEVHEARLERSGEISVVKAKKGT